MMKILEDFLKPTQKELYAALREMYSGKTVCRKNRYILVKGEAPVMLLAHLDTVHASPVKQICKSEDGDILMSPQGIGGDDRCGVYALVTSYAQSKAKPWLLFTCDEEKGGVGAYAFAEMYGKGKLPKELDSLKMLVEIDRKGKNDAVYYDCDNPDFEEYITSKGFCTEWGSFSDISAVAPALGVAAVNLSSGYYNAHTQHEYINRKQLNVVVRKVVEIVADAAKPDFPKYEYMESFRGFGFRHSSYGSHWWEYDYEDGLYTTGTQKILKTLPKDIKEPYKRLMDYYTVDELEEMREENGDRVIPILFESEFGMSYEQMQKNEIRRAGGAR